MNRTNIAILHKCAIDWLIDSVCLNIKITPELLIVSLFLLMSYTNNDWHITNRKDFNKPIQYVNDSRTLLSNQRSSNNPIPFTTGVNNQKPITYKHPYTLFVPLISVQYTSLICANRTYWLFYVNLTFASIDYIWDNYELYNMSIK